MEESFIFHITSRRHTVMLLITIDTQFYVTGIEIILTHFTKMLVDCLLSAQTFTTELASIMSELHANRKRGSIIPFITCTRTHIVLIVLTDSTVILIFLRCCAYYSFNSIVPFHKQT
jgi:hypothetical protein